MPTELDYDELISEWNVLQRRRLELYRRIPQGDTSCEGEHQHAELQGIDEDQSFLELVLGAYEILLTGHGADQQSEF